MYFCVSIFKNSLKILLKERFIVLVSLSIHSFRKALVNNHFVITVMWHWRCGAAIQKYIHRRLFFVLLFFVVFLITKLLFLTKWVVYSKCNRTPTQGLALYRSTPPCAKMIYRFSILLLLPRSLILLLLFTYGLYVFSLPIEKLMDRPESAGWRLDVDAERGPSDVLGLGE